MGGHVKPDQFPAWTALVTRDAREARAEALRDANRFILLAARILPKRETNWKERYVYEANPDAGTAIIRYKATGEVHSVRALCRRKTKFGEACKSFAVKGYDTCISHATDEELESFGFTKAQVRRKPRTLLALDALVEMEVDSIFGVYFDALGAVDSFTGSPDHRTRMMAAEALLDRAHGKPTSKQEVSGPDGDSMTLQHLFADKPSEVTDTE